MGILPILAMPGLVLATSHSFTFQNRRQMERGSHMKRTKMGNQCGAPLMAEEKAIVILSLKQNLFLKSLKVFILKYIYIISIQSISVYKGVPKTTTVKQIWLNLMHYSFLRGNVSFYYLSSVLRGTVCFYYLLSSFKRNCLFLLSIICF